MVQKRVFLLFRVVPEHLATHRVVSDTDSSSPSIAKQGLYPLELPREAILHRIRQHSDPIPAPLRGVQRQLAVVEIHVLHT